MKFAKHINLFIVAMSLFLSSSQVARADEFYSYTQFQRQQITQSHVDVREFELSEGQVRSRVEHKLVNYLLGKTVDQYFDFGADDDVAIRSSKKLKLRVNRHRLFLVFRIQLE